MKKIIRSKRKDKAKELLVSALIEALSSGVPPDEVLSIVKESLVSQTMES
jgi:hypothetical protein